MLNIEPGEYRAKAMATGLGKTSKGKPQVAIQFRLLDPPGGLINWYGYFGDASLEITYKALDACGWTGDDISDLSSITANPVEVILGLAYETWEGKTTLKVKYINSSSGVALKDKMDANEARNFADEIKAKLILLKQNQPLADKAPPTGDQQQAEAPPLPF